MSDMMTFPKTWEEFEKSYGFTDSEEVYTNGSKLIPSFRVKQWLDHITEPRKKGKWMGKEKYMNSPEYFSWQCSMCGCILEDPTLDKPYPFCPNCGADMREGEESE